MAEALQAQFEEEVSKFKQNEKDREKYIMSRQQLEAQLTENNMVKEELTLLSDDSSVYKLIGAALVKQDLVEARANVEKRIEYISCEMKRVETALADIASKGKQQQDKITAIQQQFGKLAAVQGK